MQTLHDSEQTLLFDPWALVFSGRLYGRVRSGRQGLFHDVLLRLMPAEEPAEHFHPELGRPTKGLYSVAGPIFLKEFHDWTEEDAVEAYCFRLDVQYALNVARGDGEHGEVIEDAVTVRPKSDPRALQSLSDLDATYDGHNGRGYQAQVCQTCPEQNEVQRITGLLPQTAADSDSTALPEMIEHVEDRQRKPEQLPADTAYGSDDNVEHCAAKGVELVAPVKARHEGNEDALSALDFEIDETTREVQRCPAGNTPCTTGYSEQRDEGYALFERATCEGCPNFGRCLVYKHKKHYRLKYSKKTLRLETRRRDQDRPAFKERYRKRAGIEGLIGALKRRRGFGRLRVRGQPAVSMALYLKATGHNLFQAARCVRKQRKDPSNGPQPKQNIHSGQLSIRFGFVAVLERLSQTIASVLLPLQRHKPPYLTLHLASTKTFLAG